MIYRETTIEELKSLEIYSVSIYTSIEKGWKYIDGYELEKINLFDLNNLDKRFIYGINTKRELKDEKTYDFKTMYIFTNENNDIILSEAAVGIAAERHFTKSDWKFVTEMVNQGFTYDRIWELLLL